ncbi:hypothetical protein CTEN210_10284 [Chaetoceros tenuissimus]|uniref:Uncharacterized protein n=1 Tax=Chaetoceros tenuissimus TaxID=426638 RepID=A0AAD3H8E4_9STRA|nr:hypothetical protein CTEN210_10284 [Chaetoceros tenuissimus]
MRRAPSKKRKPVPFLSISFCVLVTVYLFLSKPDTSNTIENDLKAFLSSPEDNVDTSSYTYPTTYENFDVNHRDDSDGSDGQDDDKFHNDENDQEEETEEGQLQQQEIETEANVDTLSNENKTDSHMKEQVTSTTPTQNLVQLNTVNTTLYPMYVTACCGIGHRLSRILPVMVYANRHHQSTKIVLQEVPWSALFNDTTHAKNDVIGEGYDEGKRQGLLIQNGVPQEYWREYKYTTFEKTHTVLDRYFRDWFYSPILNTLLHHLQENMTPVVKSYFDPLYQQLSSKEEDSVSMCFHLRQGNNETGDWQKKKWRHVNTEHVLNTTLLEMQSFVHSQNATRAKIFIASDSEDIRPWFTSRIPDTWDVVQPAKTMPRPENGVWFGESGSLTANVLNQTMKNEAMAEALADVFALGACNALLIPNYSSFTYASIALTRARGNSVFFLGKDKYHDMTEFEDGREMLPMDNS